MKNSLGIKRKPNKKYETKKQSAVDSWHLKVKDAEWDYQSNQILHQYQQAKNQLNYSIQS